MEARTKYKTNRLGLYNAFWRALYVALETCHRAALYALLVNLLYRQLPDRSDAGLKTDIARLRALGEGREILDANHPCWPDTDPTHGKADQP